jgi:hypothetical protein
MFCNLQTVATLDGYSSPLHMNSEIQALVNARIFANGNQIEISVIFSPLPCLVL